jgi:hypothetical protein
MNENTVSSHMKLAAEYLAPAGTREPKKRTRLVYQGRAVTLAEAANLAGLSIAGLHRRLQAGMTLAQAIETPPEAKKQARREPKRAIYAALQRSPRCALGREMQARNLPGELWPSTMNFLRFGGRASSAAARLGR